MPREQNGYKEETDEEFVPKKAESGLQGWIECFEKAQFSGSLFCGGIGDTGEASGKTEELIMFCISESVFFCKRIPAMVSVRS